MYCRNAPGRSSFPIHCTGLCRLAGQLANLFCLLLRSGKQPSKKSPNADRLGLFRAWKIWRVFYCLSIFCLPLFMSKYVSAPMIGSNKIINTHTAFAVSSRLRRLRRRVIAITAGRSHASIEMTLVSKTGELSINIMSSTILCFLMSILL